MKEIEASCKQIIMTYTNWYSINGYDEIRHLIEELLHKYVIHKKISGYQVHIEDNEILIYIRNMFGVIEKSDLTKYTLLSQRKLKLKEILI